MTLPATIPRITDLREFYQDPFNFLAQARSNLGEMFVLREGAPLFSRSSDCAGAIAVFGKANYQAVLTDADLFGMPISAAQHLLLPANLINLNRGLHSMRGQEHDQHQRVLLRVLGEQDVEQRHEAITAGLQKFIRQWDHGQTVPMLTEMRRLTLEVSTRYLFGERYDESAAVAILAEKFFHLRREVTSTVGSPSESGLASLVDLGTSLDAAMRKHIGWSRRQADGVADGLLSRLARLKVASGEGLSDDELIGHGNVLFMSSNEPIAVALTWTLLILSQLTDLRRVLRDELAEIVPKARQSLSTLSGLPRLDSVISEILRLLTPNAMMSRVTTRAGSLGEVMLPARCEVVLCPFLAHRDAAVFSDPDEFRPERWQGVRPSPFEYFPFGAGGHFCVGRSLALHVIKAALATILARHEIVLANDQEIDWQVQIIFMPGSEPMMKLQNPDAISDGGGKLLGPVRELIRW
jgi:cytochrome P450